MVSYLFGYDVLSADMADGAKILNICARLGISYRQQVPKSEDFTIHVSLTNSVRLRNFCEKNGICLCIVKRCGVPIALRALLCRVGILIGILVCFFIIRSCSNVIWDIRIEGNASVPESHIKETLAECGVSVGTKKEDIDASEVQNKFLVKSDEISWISVNITGTVAEVEVREAVSAAEDNDYACSNLIATQNGTIIEFQKVKGNIAVKLGEAVSRGQLLVGGVYGDENSALRFVRASGSVIALCEREYNIEIPLKFDKKIYTGRKKVKKSFIFFEKEVKLFVNSRNLYTNCDIIEEIKYFNFFGLGELPFGIRTCQYVEYEVEACVRDESEAYEQAIYELWQKYYTDSPYGIVNSKRIVGQIKDNAYLLYASIESLENIAEEKQVEINITG